MGCNGSFDALTTDLTAYKPLVHRILTDQSDDRDRSKQTKYFSMTFEIHLVTGIALSVSLMERGKKRRENLSDKKRC